MIPIRTSISPRRTPYANYGLIAVTVIVFLMTYAPRGVRVGEYVVREPLRPWADKFILTPDSPEGRHPNRPGQFAFWQLITYAFLHASWAHIAGNLLFLYIFGNNVNDKLGNIGFLCFYLLGAVFSGLGHMFFSASPVLGASGAVAAVTGAYLVLFPKTVITVLYWFFLIGTFEIPAIYFIGLKMIVIDNMLAAYDDLVAYDAHLAGYAYGIVAIMLLLAKGLIRRENFDLLFMITQWNRRRRFRDAVSDGYDPFSGRAMRKNIRVKQPKRTEAQQAEYDKILQIRGDISRLLGERNPSQAAKLYTELLDIDPDHILPRQHQLDIANQLMSMGSWPQSARAYEGFLAHYPSYEHLEQVELMLGILYCRYLDRPTEAIRYLKSAQGKLSDPGQLQMCNEELQRLEN